MQSLTLEQLRQVWAKICKNPDGRSALAKLAREGFDIGHLSPRDPTLQNPSWADLIAALPFLPNTPTRRQLHRRTEMRKYRPLIPLLHYLALKMEDPFYEVNFLSQKNLAPDEIINIPKRLRETADFLKHFFSWDWSTRERNARNTVIAVLRYEIRARTRRAHDAELNALIDAAFRAAGRDEGWYMGPSSLGRIEEREKEGRVKAMQRLRSLASKL